MINRNNYEEYFLLLADNELSATEAAAVRQFAAQHPDMAEELDILLTCKLELDPLPVFPKEKLLRPVQWDAENLAPVQMQLLLLLDGELPPAEQQQLKQQIAANAALQKDWNRLQQTRLVAEAIAHPNKAVLRRSAASVRPLLWVRWAAAAAVVAGLGWLLWLQQEPHPAGNTLAGNVEQAQKTSTTTPADAEPQPTATQDAEPQSTIAIANTTPAAQPHMATRNVVSVQKAVVQRTINNNPSPDQRSTTDEPSETAPVMARQHNPDLLQNISADEPALPMQVAHLEPHTANLPVLAASHKTELVTGSNNGVVVDEDDYVTIGAAHVNKQKVRGLLRNVTRTVARSFSKSKMEPDVYVAR